MNPTILFNHYDTFVSEATASLPPIADATHESVHEIFNNYEYPVSSWPVIIDSEISNKLEKMCVRLSALLRKIPACYFKNDVKKIADFYFNGNEMLAQFVLMCHEKEVEIGSRLDLTYTENGFKVLEVNIGTSIGGWQIQSFDALIRSMHSALSSEETSANFTAINTQQKYAEFLIEKIKNYVPGIANEINIIIVGLPKVEKDTKMVSDGLYFFNELIQKELHKRNLTGKVYDADPATLQFTPQGLFLNNIQIHSVLYFSFKDTDEIPPILTRAFITDKIYFPDHIGTAMLGDKRNLGILRTLAEKKTFSEEDNALLLDCIPWAAELKNQEVTFRSQTTNLLELLKTQKDQFVIKPAAGFQGKSVFVGKFLSQDAWEKAIEESLPHAAFIAQEFCESLNFHAPNNENEWTPHKLIWGAFGFGNNYGGVWVRMSSSKTDGGVINSATGAIEAIVYEGK
ncbi:hypothetical protein H2O64_17605 [Kordia sp. YSTF-M3]|uniref:Circularly permuted type 2 ATP-grasp protein n=1 Tax=Kordia aestuariivivens TaxID=2759037 RepID=A0ABR7QD56_9FLAO|nr:hypothetical protein [Kordia aestuariivivens]MBC8756494.1 hypothetical protein [Kordia aestuariivivens]